MKNKKLFIKLVAEVPCDWWTNDAVLVDVDRWVCVGSYVGSCVSGETIQGERSWISVLQNVFGLSGDERLMVYKLNDTSSSCQEAQGRIHDYISLLVAE